METARPDKGAFDEWVATIEPERRRREIPQLDALFQRVTGFQPKLLPGNMVGYGSYNYTYESGRSGTSLATGFSPRKAKLSIYIMPGYADFSEILGRLGKHTMGKACLYVNKLEDIDMDVLGELVGAGLENLRTQWPVEPT